MNSITLALKLSMLAALVAAAGLVRFVVSAGADAPIQPQLLWSIGAVLGVAAPIKAAIDQQPQQGPLYFGVIANVFFLLLSDYIMHG